MDKIVTRSRAAYTMMASNDQNTDDIQVSVINYFDRKFNELQEGFPSKVFFEEIKNFMIEQTNKIEKLDSTVALLQEHVKELKLSNGRLLSKVNDIEQYGRRLCLRIEDIPVVEEETAEVVLDKVRSLINEAQIEIPDSVIDRAHRIGPVRKDSDNNKTPSIIVRFSTFRHRTRLYRARKTLKSARVRLDLTKIRYKLLGDARMMVEKNPKVNFVYADINFRLRLRPMKGDDISFESMEELDEIISNL